VYAAITYRPFKGMKQIPEQPSYAQPLHVDEAAVYPGFLNRRVRWEKGAERAEDLKPEHLQAAYHRARPDFKEYLRRPVELDELDLARDQSLGRDVPL